MSEAGDKIPGAVLVDGHDSYTWAHDEHGQPFTVQTASELAERWNARCKPEHARFRVFELVPAGTVTAAALLGDLFAQCGTDREVYAIEEAAISAGLLHHCPEPDCGAGVGAPGDLCQSCGAEITKGASER